MNLASVLNIGAPAGAVIQNSNAVEGGAGFDALMETAATPVASGPMPAQAPKADVSPHLKGSIDAPVKTLDTSAVVTSKTPVMAVIAVAKAVSVPGVETEPEQPIAPPQLSIDAPRAVRDFNLRTSPTVRDDGTVDVEQPRTTEPGKGTAPVKLDIKQPKILGAVPVSRELTQKANDSDEDLSEPENSAVPADSTTAEFAPKIQIAQAPQITASVAQPVEAFSKPDTAPDRARLEMGTDAQKAPEASAKLTTPVKTVQVEPSLQAFTLPTPTVVSSTSMTAPIFGGPDNLTTHHLDLARDSQWIDQLARDIVAVAGQDGKLRFGLSPSNLGQLEVSVETKQDGVNIHMQASTEAAARIFAAEQPKLVEELRQSGVRVTNSDLLGGQQMQGQRDQSRPQNSAGQASAQLTSNLNSNRTSTHNQNTSRNGRFA
jgi:flagellar hook-length control protein FliK